MASTTVPSTKRALIAHANTTVVVVTSVAVFVLVFCGVATKTLVGQATYQNRVISAKKEARNQLKADLDAVDTLKSSYAAFIGTNQNVIGGNPTGTGDKDGNNAKIVLDALPSTYDFPALTTSLEKLLTDQKVSITNITGTDDELTQASNVSSSAPAPVVIPFQVSVQGDYNSVQNVINAFQNSIRPIQIQSLDISGDKNGLSLNVIAQTFYQPSKSLNISTKVVK